MAPKRSQQCKDISHDLIRDHDIFFQGPIQPSAWPKEHKHVFDVIRDIWAIRYKSYWKNSRLPQDLLRERRKIVVDIANTARKLRYANEATWRGLEQEIMRMFTTTAVCRVCKHELYVFEHEAEPFDRVKLAELQRRRQRRIPCTCGGQPGLTDTETQDHDDAQPIIFSTVQSHGMTHWHLDNFQDISVPMEPDRTVGLSASFRMQQALRASSSNINHYPVKGPNEVLYPFLVIEAKRALKTPGFAAIEAQTAFPLRRILLLQAALQRESGVDFQPLAWFFANQGDEWRLYAGTLKEDQVHVYDLWHGTVESADGSLQILLIVDYLWTWARDVYRPEIRDCLYALAPSLRDVTPSTLRSLSRSQSVLSEQRSILLRTPQADVTMEDGLPINGDVSNSSIAVTSNSILRLRSYLSVPHTNRDIVSSQTCVWHSDLVKFSFCCTLLPDGDSVSSSVQEVGRLSSKAFESLYFAEAVAIIQWTHLYDLEKSWTGENSILAAKDAAGLFGNQWRTVTLRFSSFCRPEDWQIVRHLECFVWRQADIQDCSRPIQQMTALALQEASRLDHYTKIAKTLSAIRNLSGEKSVLCALNETRLTLCGFSFSDASNSTRWTSLSSTNQIQVGDFFTSLANKASRILESSQVIALDQSTQSMPHSEDFIATLPLPEEAGQMSGMLALKAQSWSAQCPKFCLFVLVDIEASDRQQLGSVLREAIENRNFYGPLDEQSQDQGSNLTSEDREILRRWVKFLR